MSFKMKQMIRISIFTAIVLSLSTVYVQAITPEPINMENNFLSTSLQRISIIEKDKLLYTTLLYMSPVFEESLEEGVYEFKEWYNANFELPRTFTVFLLYEYNDVIVRYGKQKENSYSREEPIVLIDYGEESLFEIPLPSETGNVYFYQDRIYYSELITQSDDFVIYRINKIDLYTQEKSVVFEYEYDLIRSSHFVIGRKGEIIFSLGDTNSGYKIFMYKDSAISQVSEKNSVVLLDVHEEGILYLAFYTHTPNNASNDSEYRYQQLISYSDGNEKVLLERAADGEEAIVNVIVLDDVYLVLPFGRDKLEKYNFEGVLLETIPLTNWPNLGRRAFHESQIVYYDGKLKDVFFRGDTGVLEMINLDIK